MKLTPKLKSWLKANCEVADDADDSEFEKAAVDALSSETLSGKKFADLTADPDAVEADVFSKQLDSIGKGIAAQTKLLERMLTKQAATKTEHAEDEGDDAEAKCTKAGGKWAFGKCIMPKAADEVEDKATPTQTKEAKPAKSKMAQMVARLGGTPDEDQDDIEVRVKAATERYSTTKSAAMFPEENPKTGRRHVMAGQRMTDFGRPLDTSSDLDKALAGAWAKFQVLAASPRHAGNAQRAWEMLPEHDKELLLHLTEKSDWDDSHDNRMRTTKGYRNREGGFGLKALIDDATSGGLEAAPIVFDDMVIQTPLLHGELFPLVTTKPIDRGRRIEGVSTGTVTSSWGGVDDSAISLFSTTSYVSAFDTTIYRWEGAVRIGLDFLSDTPIDFGAHISAQYGQRLLEDLDDVIASGNGTTQPEGIINKTGATTVAWGGATSIGNYESLRFGVAKPEHNGAMKASAVFCGTETSYQRACALSVTASDFRRLKDPNSVNNYDDYRWMERPYKINESLGNTKIFYAILAQYWMYRRKGLAIRTSTEGDTLIRNNELLMVAMARYGGQQTRGGTIAKTTTAPA